MNSGERKYQKITNVRWWIDDKIVSSKLLGLDCEQWIVGYGWAHRHNHMQWFKKIEQNNNEKISVIKDLGLFVNWRQSFIFFFVDNDFS